MKKIVFDLDGTLCEESSTFERSLAKPRNDIIEIINKTHNEGNFVMIYTARSWAEYRITEKWLKDSNVNYDLLICGKPIYDYWVDDRCINVNREQILIKEKIYG
jgi:hydroxymethylpyrimidine pyrophosphatase-like HAD family hydrolase